MTVIVRMLKTDDLPQVIKICNEAREYHRELLGGYFVPQDDEQEKEELLHTKNAVKKIYDSFSAQDISDKIAQLITPSEINIPVEVIYQTIEDLHDSCPTNTGDWYFTGNYPTPGGNKVVNRSFINFIEGNTERAY